MASQHRAESRWPSTPRATESPSQRRDPPLPTLVVFVRDTVGTSSPHAAWTPPAHDPGARVTMQLRQLLAAGPDNARHVDLVAQSAHHLGIPFPRVARTHDWNIELTMPSLPIPAAGTTMTTLPVTGGSSVGRASDQPGIGQSAAAVIVAGHR